MGLLPLLINLINNMAKIKKINVNGVDYEFAHEGVLKNSGFEVVTSLPTTDLFDGRIVTYNDSIYYYNKGEWTEISKGTYENEEELYSYGVEKDLRISLSTCTRVGNPNLHRTLPVQSRMRGCLLDDDGNIVEYLHENDWTTATRDGSKGQVMVKIPAHYRRFYTKDEGNIIGVRISLINIEGYHYVPDMFVSAYEASIERSTGKLCSVVNYGGDYRGGNNNASWDNTYRSLLGRPVTSISRTTFRSAARKRNESNTSWNCYLYHVHKALFWLYTVEYANLNSQAAYNSELTSDGFHQGGLGAGVSDWSSSEWYKLNIYQPFIPCGHTDSLGNSTGVVAYTAYNEDGSELKTSNVPRYRGVENPFGHIFKLADGINVRISPTEADGGDNLSKVFVCEDLPKLNDTNYNGYKYVGNEARSRDFIKEIIFGEGGEIIPSLTGGSSTQFFCDFHDTKIPKEETLCGVMIGGHAIGGANNGLAEISSNILPSDKVTSVGSRLCFIPHK